MRVEMRGSFLLAVVVLCIPFSAAQAVLFPFEIFTNNGQYSDGSLLDLTVEVSNGTGVADFTFHNNSQTQCSIARIYFDDGSLLGIDEILNGAGTLFDRGSGNLPAANLLVPPFVADREFTIGAEPPPSANGVNNIGAGEWVKIRFNLINGGTLQDVLDELSDGTLRVGLHVIGFDDGSSEAAILVPEPATLCIFGLGAFWFS